MHDTTFSAETRRQNLARMGRETFDLLVVGGGITGAGIASLAARRGYTVALVEQGDFASGASSKSSKLVHGGLRYLASGEFGLVFEACRERRTLLRLAPHLVWPLPFVLPVYRERRAAGRIRLAMWLYDALAVFRNVERHRIWPAAEALAHEPILDPEGLLLAARYYDCGADDARLTLATILEAHRAGAVIASYAEAAGLLRAGERAVGAQVLDLLGGAELEVRARLIVSAVGPWTDALLGAAGAARRWLRPSKGAHIVVPHRRAPSQAAVTFSSPRDGRPMFLVPWGEHAIVGTTDTPYADDPSDVYATAADVAEILEAARLAFPALRLDEGDVVSAYAGVRPLVADNGPSSVQNSREYHVAEVRPGLLAIAGGKLTTFRAMASAAVGQAARILARDHRVRPPSVRPRSRLSVPGDWAAARARLLAAFVERTNLRFEAAWRLVGTYGGRADQVLELLRNRPDLAAPLAGELPAVAVQVVYAVRNEMALTLEDVLDRRTHALALAADQGMGATDRVADLMAKELGWTAAERAAQVAHYAWRAALSRRWRGERCLEERQLGSSRP